MRSAPRQQKVRSKHDPKHRPKPYVYSHILANYLNACDHCRMEEVFEIDSSESRRIDYGYVANPVRVDEYLGQTDLTVSNALLRIDSEEDRASYAALYQWFEDNTATTGTRHFGERLPGVSFAHAAQRGIHTPSGRKYAVSITVKHNSIYSKDDGGMIDLGDGTWVLHYSAHRNNVSGEQDSMWNQKLLNCLTDGVPVGVFVQKGTSSDSYFRALAFVEEYIPGVDIFVLHGPVTPQTERHFSADKMNANALSGRTPNKSDISPTAEDLKMDTRLFALKKSAVRQGQSSFRNALLDAYDGRCAISGYEVESVIQAAHIIEYRGSLSNDVRNGMPLRADLHILFDRGFLGVDPDHFKVAIGSQIEHSPYAKLDGRSLLLPSNKTAWPKEEYVAASFARFKQVQAAC